MSRVADAVERAALLARDSSFSDDDHPWGGNLVEPSRDMAALDVTPFERTHAVSPLVPPDRPTSRMPREAGAAVRPQPPVAADDAHRPHLVALVERLFLPVSGEPPHCVAFSGLGAESGVITAAAAQLIAHQTDATVCVVDANFSKPSLHRHFGTLDTAGPAGPTGTGELLTESACEVGRNLWLLPARALPGRTGLGSEPVRMRLAQFIARFDFVLVDIEPVWGPGDAAGFAPLVDGVILVLAADATRRETARRATQALQGAGASVLGAVLTNRRFPIPDPLYRRI